MKVCLLLFVTCVVVTVRATSFHLNFCGKSAPSNQKEGCQYFTKNLYGDYVCDRNQKPERQCPALRPTCTRGFAAQFPIRCETDNDCAYDDKCCCDACLEYTVCKPSY